MALARATRAHSIRIDSTPADLLGRATDRDAWTHDGEAPCEPRTGGLRVDDGEFDRLGKLRAGAAHAGHTADSMCWGRGPGLNGDTCVARQGRTDMPRAAEALHEAVRTSVEAGPTLKSIPRTIKGAASTIGDEIAANRRSSETRGSCRDEKPDLRDHHLRSPAHEPERGKTSRRCLPNRRPVPSCDAEMRARRGGRPIMVLDVREGRYEEGHIHGARLRRAANWAARSTPSCRPDSAHSHLLGMRPIRLWLQRLRTMAFQGW